MTRKLFLVWIVILVAVLGSSAQTSTEYFNQGVNYGKASDWTNAITAYSNAIRQNPNYEEAIHNRGIAYWNLKNYALAVADLKRAVQLAPNEAGAFADLGSLLLDSINWDTTKPDFEAAYGHLQKALRLEPGNKSATESIISVDSARTNAKARAAYDQEKYDDAIALYAQALAKRPEYGDALFGRGRAHLTKGNYDLSIADYNAYIKINPNEPAAFTNRGLAYYYKGKYDEAIADQTKAITMNPTWLSDAYTRRGQAFLQKKDLVTAISDLEQAVKLKPDSIYALSNRALAYRDNKQLDLAIADATRVISLDPKDADSYLDRGDLFKAKGDFVNALSDYDQAAVIDAKSTSPFYRRIAVFKEQKDLARAEAEYIKIIALSALSGHHDRGHFYWNQGKLELATTDFTECIRQKGDAAVYYWDRAETLRLAKKFTEAKADYDQAIKLSPTATFYAARGNYFLAAGDLVSAEADIRKAAELAPNDATTLIGLANLYVAKGDFVTAASQFDAALSKFPNNTAAHLGRALMLEKQKKTAEAIAALNKALELNSDYYEARIQLERLAKPAVKTPAKRTARKRN